MFLYRKPKTVLIIGLLFVLSASFFYSCSYVTEIRILNTSAQAIQISYTLTSTEYPYYFNNNVAVCPFETQRDQFIINRKNCKYTSSFDTVKQVVKLSLEPMQSALLATLYNERFDTSQVDFKRRFNMADLSISAPLKQTKHYSKAQLGSAFKALNKGMIGLIVQ